MSAVLPQRPLGSTGISVSALGLGTVKFGRTTALKYTERFELPSEQDLAALLATARELGINLLDTAPAYGEAEARLGRALAGQREDWVICTKTGEEHVDGISHFDYRAAHTRRSVERSLRSLDTDYLDCVLVHSDGNDEAVLRDTDVVETLQRLRDVGSVRSIGASVKTLAGALLAVSLVDVVMLTLNVNDTVALPALQAAQRRGVGTLVKKPLDSGRRRDQADADMHWITSRPGVSATLLGTLNAAHLAAAARAVATLGY